MDNNFSIFKSTANQYPSTTPDSLKKTKDGGKVSDSTRDRLSSVKEAPLHMVHSVRKNLSEFNENVKKILRVITIIFNYVVFGKKIETHIHLKEAHNHSKQTEIFKNSVNSPKTTGSTEIVPLLNRVVPKLKNSQTLRITSSSKKNAGSGKDVKKYIDKKLSRDVKAMDQSCAQSSEVLKNLTSEPPASGASISCEEALQHLAKINTELTNMKSSTKKVHDDLDELTLLLTMTKKSFDYSSVSQKQKKVFTDAREYSNDLAQTIGPAKDSFATSMHATFGKRNKIGQFKEGMIIEMHNPLLNCKVTINSKEDFNKFKAECIKSDKLLSSFRTDIPYITRFAAEDSFSKVRKKVKYR